jgi:putative FmdB family regulatory protein
MPLYTFKCPSCNIEKEVLQKMSEPEPVCMECADSSCGVHIVEMERVFKVNAKPISKDGSWNFKKEKKEKPK